MIKNLLIDVDGVLWEGEKEISGAQKTIEFLDKNRYNYLFLTNISRYTKKKLAEKLSKHGIRISEKNIFTPIETTIEFLKSKKPNARCYLISEKGVKEQFKNSGLKIIKKDFGADFVVVFLYEKTDYQMLDAAFRNLMSGAELVSNSDLKSLPFRDKRPSIATGAFVKALEYCSGKTAYLTGKPNKNFFAAALKHLNAKPAQTLMVGDTISTDIIGAKNSGLKTVLVKTGNYSKKELKKSVLKPDAVIDSIAKLPEVLHKKRW